MLYTSEMQSILGASLRMFYCVPEIYSTWVIGCMLRRYSSNQLQNTLLQTRLRRILTRVPLIETNSEMNTKKTITEWDSNPVKTISSINNCVHSFGENQKKKDN